MISRQQIRQFLAVVDAGNFSRAAAAIGRLGARQAMGKLVVLPRAAD